MERQGKKEREMQKVEEKACSPGQIREPGAKC